VERENELAYMMESVDVAVLSLTLDTAHTVLGGDPAPTFTRYADRVYYVHIKDILPASDLSVSWWLGFCEPGRGIGDFPAVVAIVQGAGFNGVLCVELDGPRVCGYKSADICHQ
jgi:inosose dehydratase